VPWDLYEARNAVRIARWAGAERYAPDTFQKAVQNLENAEGYLTGKAGTKPIGTVAREAVQMAEDARIITVRKIDEERLASERQAGAGEARAESHATRHKPTPCSLHGTRTRRSLLRSLKRTARRVTTPG
jgi:hypothetical protein